jgi:hypothetical protein
MDIHRGGAYEQGLVLAGGCVIRVMEAGDGPSLLGMNLDTPRDRFEQPA